VSQSQSIKLGKRGEKEGEKVFRESLETRQSTQANRTAARMQETGREGLGEGEKGLQNGCALVHMLAVAVTKNRKRVRKTLRYVRT